MTNEEIIQEAREVREMNEREAEMARMSPEEIAVQQRANELVLRIGRMGDDELMSPIFKEALMNERRIAMKEEREACAKYLDDAARECWKEGDARHASYAESLAEAIRARSS